MGINMRVFSLPDHDIHASVANPKRITGQLHYSSTDDNVELWDCWRELDYALGQRSAVTQGDVTIAGGSEGIHAIQSASVPAFAQMLRALSDTAVRERLDPVAMRAAGVWVAEYPGAVDEVFREILPALHELRDLATRAEAQGNGLVFCRHEGL